LAEGLKVDEIVGPGSDYYPTVSLEQGRETLRVAYRLLEAYPHGVAPPGGVVWSVEEAEGGRLVGVFSSRSAAEQMADQRSDDWHVKDWLILDEPLDVSGLEEDEIAIPDVRQIYEELGIDPEQNEDTAVLQALEEAAAEIDRGEGMPADEVIARLRKRLKRSVDDAGEENR
jgi:hypothetical protein